MATSVPATAIGSAPAGEQVAAARRRLGRRRGGGDHLGQGDGDGVERPDPDAPQLRVALLGGQVDHPEDGAVVLPVGEEALGHRQRGVPARLLGPVAADQLGQLRRLVDHALGQHPDGLLHVGEVLVEGGRRRPGLPRDVGDLDRAPRRGGQELDRGVEQALAGLAAPLAGHPPVGGRHLLGVGVEVARRRPRARGAVPGMAAQRSGPVPEDPGDGADTLSGWSRR